VCVCVYVCVCMWVSVSCLSLLIGTHTPYTPYSPYIYTPITSTAAALALRSQRVAVLDLIGLSSAIMLSNSMMSKDWLLILGVSFYSFFVI
jgi:hypothetical protein